VWWRERWRDFRNRRLADPAFQARALTHPLLRPVARRRARESFDLCAGFVYSQVLLACIRLGVLEALRGGPLTAAALAAQTGLDAAAIARLLRAAETLDLVEAGSAADSWALGAVGASLLANPGALAMVEHHELFYRDLADPVALLRGTAGTTQLRKFWSYSGAAAPGVVTGYSRLMADSQPLVSQTVIEAAGLDAARLLLDVGGGEGGFAIAAAQRHPQLRCIVFDLPGVVPLARERIAAAGLAGRIEVLGGDFLADALPAGADHLSFVRVLHDHDDAVVRRLLRIAHDALEPGGRVLVAEPLADAGSAPRVGAAYFGFYLLAMGQGRARSAAEYAGLLEKAGFAAARQVPTALPLASGLVVAGRAGG
jgi:demethylspheroidene O-methyltransferase